MPPPDLDDLTLHRAALRDPAACRAVVGRYQGLVFAVAARVLGAGSPDLADVAQEAFLKMFAALDRFDARGPARFPRWLATIATRVAIDHARRRRTVIPLDAIRDSAAAPRAELEREVARLRAILAANHLSPETGDAAAPQRRGIDSDGETDLTPDEWRQLAQRGELRFAIPGTGGRDPDARINHQAHEMGLRDHEVLGVREVFRRELERLLGELRGLYREAAGTDPGNLSLDALQSEIRDKTPGDTVALVDWRLAQERGGLAEAPAARADASPYERMMRAVVGYEARVAEALTALVGATASHDLLHGPGAVGGHSYGRTARVGDAGASAGSAAAPRP